MKITVFEPISLCFGVERSINLINNERKNFPEKKIFCLGHPIHNEHISTELKNMNIKIIDANIEAFYEVVPSLPKDSIVVFSAHGHDIELEKLCLEHDIKYLDTTCPIVKSIDSKIKTIIDKKQKVVYLGKEKHAESYAIIKNNPKVIFKDIFSNNLVDIQYKNAVVLNQTTILEDTLLPLYNEIMALNDDVQFINSSCKYVNDRFKLLKNLDNNQYDFVVIIGSTTSSNTMELYKLADKKFGKEKALLVSKAEDITNNQNLLKNAKHIAVFSGTSAPLSFVNDIIEILKSL